jgi:thiol:disulfide interchange protein DsbD
MMPQRFIGLVFALLIGMFTGGEAAALPQSAATDDPSPHSDAELVSDVASIQPGTPFTVALRMTMDDGWHSYWTNPGDSGQPTSIEWALPTDFSVGDIQWPYPHRIDAGPLTSYGYSDEVLLLTEITPPEDLETGTSVTLDGLAEWLICADICLPAEADVSLTLPVRNDAPAPNAQGREAIAAAKAALPKPVSNWTVQATRSEGSYALNVTPPSGWTGSLEGANFYPDEKAVLDHAAPQPVSKEGGSYLIALQRSEYAAEPAERLTGVLVAPEGTTWEDGVRAMAVDVPVEDAQNVSAALPSEDGSSTALWWTLLSAFVGGLLLNLMPCVFPVLSVKILGFAKQGGDDERTIRRHGLVFGVGVLVSFWVLAGALLALRAAGSEIGWGFQLQSPLFVALMTMLFFGIGLNLLGVFEIGNQIMNWGGRMERSANDTYSGSFLSGVLATVVATPCTAPFMGAALGVALTLSAAGSLLVFTALGAGMAAPYVALSMTPSLLQRLPKPGAWMETLKQVLAFPMFAAAVWLLWVFGQQTGPSGMALLLFGLLLLSLAGWMLGRWSALQSSTRTRVITRTVAVLSLIGALVVSVMGTQSARPANAASTATTQDAEWQAFSPETVEQLRAEGRPVFIDFTAAWCLTCQVNKRTALSSAAVQQAAREKNVALVRADWTNRDPAITRALESHGRSGVPVYVLYKGDGSEPELLPEILTEQIVLDALADIPDASASTPATADASTTQ